jgi:hypothetical protein
MMSFIGMAESLIPTKEASLIPHTIYRLTIRGIGLAPEPDPAQGSG